MQFSYKSYFLLSYPCFSSFSPCLSLGCLLHLMSHLRAVSQMEHHHHRTYSLHASYAWNIFQCNQAVLEIISCMWVVLNAWNTYNSIEFLLKTALYFSVCFIAFHVLATKVMFSIFWDNYFATFRWYFHNFSLN